MYNSNKLTVVLPLLCTIASWPVQATSIPSWASLISSSTHKSSSPTPLVGDDVELIENLTQGGVRGVRKMSGDESEMFFAHYWDFGRGFNNVRDLSHSSMAFSFQAPFALHNEHQMGNHTTFDRLSRALLPRQSGYRCPTTSRDCGSIGRPNSCCSIGLVCQLIQDTGEGDVGCCVEGETCDGVVQCGSGSTSCPGNNSGGCCLPGFSCSGIGCARGTTTTVIIQPTATSSPRSTRTPTTSSPDPASSTTSGIAPAASSTTTSSSSSVAASSSTHTSTSSLSDSLDAPVRPTSVVTATATVTSSFPSFCPTGFYQCSAHYPAGCCRVGRDCAHTDCPPATSTTVANTHGVTVVAPTGTGVGRATVGLGTGSCPSGWTGCPASLDGGCCPARFGCVAGASCLATPANSQALGTVPKQASGGAARFTKRLYPIMAAASFISMLFI